MAPIAQCNRVHSESESAVYFGSEINDKIASRINNSPENKESSHVSKRSGRSSIKPWNCSSVRRAGRAFCNTTAVVFGRGILKL